MEVLAEMDSKEKEMTETKDNLGELIDRLADLQRDISYLDLPAKGAHFQNRAYDFIARALADMRTARKLDK